MPYGAGPRQCIGLKFAQMEMLLCIQHLLHRYTFRLAEGQVPLPIMHTIVMRPRDGVQMYVERRAK